jgi:predicted metal-binding membrane protein
VQAAVAVVSRAVTFTILVAVATVTWAFLVQSQIVMESMEGEGFVYDLAVAMMDPFAIVPYFAASALMWTAMMVAMMIPAAMPMVAVFARLDRRSGGRGAQADSAFFVGGYLFVWIAFGLAATLVQWVLHRGGVLEGHLLALPTAPGAALLIITGMYELSPLKTACLTHCRSPLSFLLGNWREGATGAFEMGARHGVYCLGCCWMLMLLMFAYGVMSAAAMAALTLFVVAERTLPLSGRAAKLPGIALILWGTGVLAWVALGPGKAQPQF